VGLGRFRRPSRRGHPGRLRLLRPAAILAELDACNADDIEYRAAFSTGARTPLKRGETWRGRLAAWVNQETSAQVARDRHLARRLYPPTARETAVLKAAAATATPAPTGRVFGYARVSTVQQADEGQSLDVQQRVIAGYAQMHGLTIDKTFVERGVSGSKPLGDRPEGAALLAALQPGDTVITPKLDRMFRSALDALDVLGKLKAGGVNLHMIDLGGT
jgi:hypothetical protein